MGLIRLEIRGTGAIVWLACILALAPEPAIAESNTGTRGADFMKLHIYEQKLRAATRAKEIFDLFDSGRMKARAAEYVEILPPSMIEDPKVASLFGEIQAQGLREDILESPYQVHLDKNDLDKRDFKKKCKGSDGKYHSMTTSPGERKAVVCVDALYLAWDQLTESSSLSLNAELMGLLLHEHLHHFGKGGSYEDDEDESHPFAYWMAKSLVAKAKPTVGLSDGYTNGARFYIDPDFGSSVLVTIGEPPGDGAHSCTPGTVNLLYSASNTNTNSWTRIPVELGKIAKYDLASEIAANYPRDGYPTRIELTFEINPTDCAVTSSVNGEAEFNRWQYNGQYANTTIRFIRLDPGKLFK